MFNHFTLFVARSVLSAISINDNNDKVNNFIVKFADENW